MDFKANTNLPSRTVSTSSQCESSDASSQADQGAAASTDISGQNKGDKPPKDHPDSQDHQDAEDSQNTRGTYARKSSEFIKISPVTLVPEEIKEQIQFSHYYLSLTAVLNDFKEQAKLEHLAKEIDKCDVMFVTEPSTSKLHQRCQIVLSALQSNTVEEWASYNDVHAKTLRKWLLRFLNQGCAGLYDYERPGRPKKELASLETLLELLATRPCNTHPSRYKQLPPKVQESMKKSYVWNVSLLSQVVGVSRSTMYKLLRTYNITIPTEYQSGSSSH